MDSIQSLLTVAVEFLPAQIWDCVKEHGNVKFVLLGRIFCKLQDTSVLCSLTRNLSELSKNVIEKYCLLDERYPLTESILFCIATLFYFWLARRKIALLLKPLLLKRCDQSFMNSKLKDIENRIFSRLQHNMESKGLQLVERSWNPALDDGQKPVIVFCVLSSRIGTDIENAISGVHGNSPVVLVLLHCVLSSLLRGDLSDDEELLDTTLRNRMTVITHFAFSDREGLYDCHQNTVGFKKLLDAVISTTTSETLHAKALFSSS